MGGPTQLKDAAGGPHAEVAADAVTAGARVFRWFPRVGLPAGSSVDLDTNAARPLGCAAAQADTGPD